MANVAQRAKKSKAKDGRPSRQRYWDSHRLEKSKVCNILANKQREHIKECDGSNCTCPVMTEKQALAWWQKQRQGRLPDKYIPATRK